MVFSFTNTTPLKAHVHVYVCVHVQRHGQRNERGWHRGKDADMDRVMGTDKDMDTEVNIDRDTGRNRK